MNIFSMKSKINKVCNVILLLNNIIVIQIIAHLT